MNITPDNVGAWIAYGLFAIVLLFTIPIIVKLLISVWVWALA